MAHAGERIVDVEALVAELRRDAAKWQQALAGAAPEALAEPASPRESRAARLAELRRRSDPRSAELKSHRGAIGTAVLAIKRLFIRLLTPIWEQQTSFDRGVVDLLDALAADGAEQSAELNRRWDDLERRLVALEDAVARGRVASAPESLGFDYQRFEEEFRGSPERVRAAQERYLDHFPGPGAGPVLELGCGPGTFLDLLRRHGIEARGVDKSAAAVARCRAAGLDAEEGDLLAALEACTDGSLGAVVSFQVLEHLTLPVILRLLRVAHRKLRPGGVFLAETINLASLIVFARAWTIDPTHRQGLHPLTLRFLVDQAGFSHSELIFGGDVEPEKRVVPAAGDEAGARNAAILNEVVFGPQDYAIVARV